MKTLQQEYLKVFLAITDQPERQDYLLGAIIKNGWNVRQAEQFVTSLKTGILEASKASARTSTETKETKMLANKLGTSVNLRRMSHGGKLEIGYKNDEDFVRIINLFF